MPYQRVKVSKLAGTNDDWSLGAGVDKVEAVQLLNADHPFGESYISGQSVALAESKEAYIMEDVASLLPGIYAGAQPDIDFPILRVGIPHIVRASKGKFNNDPIIGITISPIDGSETLGPITSTEINDCLEITPDTTSDDYEAAPYKFYFSEDLTVPGQAGWIEEVLGFRFAPPTWWMDTQWISVSPRTNGKGVHQPWKWSDLNDLRVIVSAGAVDISGGGPPVYAQGSVDLTWFEVLVDYGPHWDLCARCCCCCLCFCPTIIIDADLIRIRLLTGPGPDYTTFSNPRFCFRLCLQGPLYDSHGAFISPCWFYCYPVGTLPDPGPEFPCTYNPLSPLGPPIDGVTWFRGEAALLAGETNADGCSFLTIELGFSYPNPDYDSELPEGPGNLQFLTSPPIRLILGNTMLIDCKPWHYSRLDSPAISTVTYSVNESPFPECSTLDPGDTSPCYTNGAGGYSITCDPDYDTETCP